MDSKDLTEIYKRSESSIFSKYVIDQTYTDIRDFVLRGETLEFHTSKLEEINELLRLLGLSEGVTEDKVAFYRIAGSLDEDKKIIESLGITGTVLVPDLLDALPDMRWVFVQNPNDCIASVVIHIDAETLLIVTEELKEYELVCSECANYRIDQCPHEHQEDYTYSYWALLITPEDIDNVDWERGELW